MYIYFFNSWGLWTVNSTPTFTLSKWTSALTCDCCACHAVLSQSPLKTGFSFLATPTCFNTWTWCDFTRCNTVNVPKMKKKSNRRVCVLTHWRRSSAHRGGKMGIPLNFKPRQVSDFYEPLLITPHVHSGVSFINGIILKL